MTNSTYTNLMAAVGASLHAWSQVETAMGLLFYGVSGIRDMGKSGAIFDAIISFETRIAVLDAALEHDPQFSMEEKEVWECLSARLRKLYKKRHEAAHFSVPDMAAPRISPFFTWDKHGKNTAKYLTVTQVAERSSKFSNAAQAVGWFNHLVLRRGLRQEQQPPQHQEPPMIVHIRELLARKKAESEPPPLP